jgi:YfiR/HmsC-like
MPFLNPGRRCGAIWRVGLAAALGWPAAAAHCQTADEYQVKAAFIYNFAKFVEWPPEAFKTPAEPMTICVLGQNPFGGGLDRIVSGKAIEGRALAVRQISGEQQASGCQILFVSSSEGKRVGLIVSAFPRTGTLTIGETEDFALDGGVINFKIEDGRVRLQVNVKAAEKARLRISSKLLSLAQIVNGK